MNKIGLENLHVVNKVINKAGVSPELKNQKIYLKALNYRFLNNFNDGEYISALKDAKKIVEIKPA